MTMKEQYTRTSLLIGEKNIDLLRTKSVAVFGIGGVGSFAAEALARSGIGTLALIDDDTVSVSNINRQLIATHETVGQEKVEVMRERVRTIDPDMHVETYPCFYTQETANTIDLCAYDYIIDAIDTVASKLTLIERAKQCNVPIISSMGTGNKFDAAQLRVANLSQTRVCPLARVMRRELKKRGITHLKVVYSEEEPRRPLAAADDTNGAHPKRQTPGSMPFVPPVAGMLIAGAVVMDLIDTTHL